MARLWSVLLWSVIAAAFIGPGTVTTAALAGNRFGLSLLWALVFSTGACVVLQEASARLAVASGRDLATALRWRGGSAAARLATTGIVAGAVILGCAAYEAGNILGGVAGAGLAVDVSPRWLALGCGALAALLLWPGRSGLVARSMSVLVAVMGIAFLAVAVALRPDPRELLEGLLVPSLPVGGGLVVLGLVGTTVVPYNLFLGSNLALGQDLRELRFGLTVAIVLGGVISMAVVVAGTAVVGELSFEQLAQLLEARFGSVGRWLLAGGLFAAGLSSAITAPLAAAITARSLFAPRPDSGTGAEPSSWLPTSWRFRAVWAGVLLTGLGFGLTGVQPIPVIVAAQALNGLVLPLAAVFLLVAVNDRRLMGSSFLNGAAANAAMVAVVFIALVLGTTQLLRAGSRVWAVDLGEGRGVVALAAGAAAVVMVPVLRAVSLARRDRD